MTEQPELVEPELPGEYTMLAPGLILEADGKPCELHKSHRPDNLTVEFHHVIPVAWQLHTVVAQPPFPGVDPSGRGQLWDERGIWICPTGHRNVHHWIVRLMRQIQHSENEDPEVAYSEVVDHRPPVEARHALDALTRYVEDSEASLLALAQQGQWGQA